MAAYDRLQNPLVRAMSSRVECRPDENMTGMGARMEFVLESDDGGEREVLRREMQEPLGEVSHPFVDELREEKFLSLMRPIYGDETSRRVMELVYSLGAGNGKDGEQSVKEILGLVATTAQK